MRSLANENKTRTAIWLWPSTIRKIDFWMKEDNCTNRSELIEKAVAYYIGRLESQDASAYLCDTISATIRGLLENSNNRLRSLLFKWAVELNMLCHTVAAHFGADEIDRRALRGFAVDEVKKSIGQISFDHALDVQRGLHEEDLWQD